MVDWKDFPWGALLTLTGMLSALVLAALNSHFSDKFLSEKDGNALGDSLRKKIGLQDERIERLRNEVYTAAKQAEEAFRHSQLVDRMITEQWERITEELIGPIREMSKEFRTTREMLVKYMEAQDNLSRNVARLEKANDSLEKELALLARGRVV